MLYQKNNYPYSILLNNVEPTIKSAYPRSPYIYIYKKIATTSKDTLSKQFIRSGRLSAWFTYLNVRIGDKCRQRTTSPKSALIHFAHAAFGERLFHLPRPVHLRTPLQGRPSPNHYSWTRGHELTNREPPFHSPRVNNVLPLLLDASPFLPLLVENVDPREKRYSSKGRILRATFRFLGNTLILEAIFLERRKPVKFRGYQFFVFR